MFTKTEIPGEKTVQSPLELRHFNAFQQVYLVRDYTEAGHDLNISRKGMLRLIERLEKSFQCPLFTEKPRGPLVATPFAERLYNDLRFLNAARESFEEQVLSIRESGRLLRIGSSSSIFRTRTFRDLFRELQSFDRVRASYAPVKSEDASKALASGTCDLHVGCWQGNSKRFTSLAVGEIDFLMLVRGGPPGPRPASYLVSLDGSPADFPPSADDGLPWQPLPESRFLEWLDHPDECPPGTRILGPDIPHDARHWTNAGAACTARHTIHLNFLRQHPYEFLDSLGRGIHQRMKSHDHS